MSEYVKFEGTTDFLVHYPALITTFTAATSIAAGEFTVIGADGRISGSSTGTGLSGSHVCAGMAVRTAAAGEKVAVIRWGFIKGATAGNTIGQGHYVEMLGGSFVGDLSAAISGPTSNISARVIGQALFGPALATSAASGSNVNVFLSLF